MSYLTDDALASEIAKVMRLRPDIIWKARCYAAAHKRAFPIAADGLPRRERQDYSSNGSATVGSAAPNCSRYR